MIGSLSAKIHIKMTQSPNPVGLYLGKIQQELSTGHAQEHSYRPALKELFEAVTGLRVVNEPKGSAHGRPDFIFVKGDIPIAWAEAKDLHVNLEKIEKSEQMERYFGYPTLILTNGLEFRFYQNGQRYGDAFVLAEKDGSTLVSKPDVFDAFVRTLADFMTGEIDTIRSAEHLAKIMGGKAKRLRDNIIAMFDPSFSGSKGEIEKIMQVLQERLIHDLDIEQFADLYAQTLVYGLFVARYHDDTPENFSRTEARERIPTSNHLLQQFFDHIAGANFETRLKFIVDELCDVFVHADVHALVHGLYQKKSDTHDPIIHFYEDFLREYDPKLRMERGVFYTPLPVVRYIVRSIDVLLKEHFDLPEGLADRAKVDWNRTVQGKKSKMQIDRVQLLDPAVGTGTFLNEVIRTIHEKFEGQQGMWPQYVEDHLIPRLHGFELMMASYTIAHLKLSMTLAESGAKDIQKRLRVFLTNSLEEPADTDINLFTFGLQGALTEEAQAAAEVKRDYPIMVVLGNPPYSGHSSNKGKWIEKLLEDYKKEPGGGKLQERNSKWLNDDYVKFIRFAEYMIEKNNQGIVAFITNHSYLDNPTFRGMRWHLLQTFDDIYIVDLHGNSKKKEVAPDGGKDENVFDIQQGVAIFIGVKKKKSTGLAKVHSLDIYGKRNDKYVWLDEHNSSTSSFEELVPQKPGYDFVLRDYGISSEYYEGIHLPDLFPVNVMGFQTHRDNFAVADSEKEIKARIEDLQNDSISTQQLIDKYQLKENKNWKLDIQRQKINSTSHGKITSSCSYRPFDQRWCFMHESINDRPRKELIDHVMHRENVCLLSSRQQSILGFRHVFCAQLPANDCVVSNRTKESNQIFPLYLYLDSSNDAKSLMQFPVNWKHDGERVPNLSQESIEKISKQLGLPFKWNYENDSTKGFLPEDIFDYIYAILHSPTYRERYKEFLKIDFPRVPFTSNKELFWKLVALGREIRLLHLMESPQLGKIITKYPVSGSNEVEKTRYEDGKVWLNKEQYFDGVPDEAWNFHIGGYQPAQKWLKDRKGRELNSDDILHYQEMIVALVETAGLMKEIDEVINKNGGYPLR